MTISGTLDDADAIGAGKNDGAGHPNEQAMLDNPRNCRKSVGKRARLRNATE